MKKLNFEEVKEKLSEIGIEVNTNMKYHITDYMDCDFHSNSEEEIVNWYYEVFTFAGDSE